MTTNSNNEKTETNSNKLNNTATETETNNFDTVYNDLYPERKGSKAKKTVTGVLFGYEGRETLNKLKCERNVYWCLRNSPLIKLLMGALKASGCDFDIRRHISCETCNSKVSGGFDPELNQVVVCHNVARRKSTVQGVLTHEMIHMFDYCQNELDLRDIRHLACTEIRAANLAHCSFLSAWIYGSASPFRFKRAHQECVKKKALSSIVATKNVSEKEAMQAINEVFPKCYADLEPIGRRCRRNSEAPELAYIEGAHYGYNYSL